jgi:hypothetical protein
VFLLGVTLEIQIKKANGSGVKILKRKKLLSAPVGIHVESPAITSSHDIAGNLSTGVDSRAKLIFISKTIPSGIIMRILATTCKLMR